MARLVSGLLLIFALAHGISIALFIHGFLLTRIELPNHNTCSSSDESPGIPCWRPPLFKRAVVLIVDALRYDFYDEQPTAVPAMHTNQLHRTKALVSEAGAAGVAVRFVADPPTTTLQRLKALLTGGIPTFVDVGNSFSATTLTEDNLAKQLHTHRRRIRFMGDDTWMAIAADQLEHAVPFESFNVKDLHTVDDGVWQNLLPSLNDTGSWDVLIAHYLGIDHAGHTHGVRSPQMVAKLMQMDLEVSIVAEQLVEQAGAGMPYEDTLLLILGDHGQTLGGDHGGGTAEETDSVLLALNLGAWHHARHSSGALDAARDVPGGSAPSGGSAQRLYRATAGAVASLPCSLAMPQIDFTATVSMLLGVPIPFGNLGKVSPLVWQITQPPADPMSGAGVLPDWCAAQASGDAASALKLWPLPLLQNYTQALRANAWQVQRYLREYALRASLPATQLSSCSLQYQQAEALFGELQKDTTAEQLAAAAAAHLRFLDAAAALAREQFTRFNYLSMGAAIALMALVLVVQAAMAWRSLPGGINWRDGRLLLQRVLVAVLCAVHALGLFSVRLVQSEGRMSCFLTAAASLVLIFAALAASLRSHTSHVRLREAAAEAGSRGEVTEQRRPMAGLVGQVSAGPSALLLQEVERSGRVIPTALWSVLFSLLLAATVVALPLFGLIDRTGQDPHDKSQPTAKFAAPTRLQGWRSLLPLTPVLLLAPLLWALRTWMVSGLRLPHPEHQRRPPPAAPQVQAVARSPAAARRPAAATAAPGAVVAATTASEQTAVVPAAAARPDLGIAERARRALLTLVPEPTEDEMQSRREPAMAQLALLVLLTDLVGFWWLAQLVPGAAEVTLRRLAVQVDLWQWLVWISDKLPSPLFGTQGGLQGLLAAAAQLPLWDLEPRLLLPRFIFTVALLWLVWQLVRAVVPGARHSGPRTEEDAVTAVSRCTMDALGVLCAVVALMLGFKGPALVVLALLQCAAMLAMLACSMHGSCAAMVAEAVTSWLHTAALATSNGSASPRAGGEGRKGTPRRRRGAKKEQEKLGGDAGEAAQGLGGDDALLSARHLVEAVQARAQAHNCLGAGVLALTSMQLFFSSGHFCEFSGLQYESAFVGYDDMVTARSGVLLVLNTFGMHMLVALALPLLCAVCSRGASFWTARIAVLQPLEPATPALAARHGNTTPRPQTEPTKLPVTTAGLAGHPAPISAPDGVASALIGRAGHAAFPVLLKQAALVYVGVRTLNAGAAMIGAAVLRRHLLVWALFAPKLVFEVWIVVVSDVVLLAAAAMAEFIYWSNAPM